jgi:hypothetical protein
MLAFLNENIKDKLCGGCDCTAFVPAVTYALSGNNLTVTDATAYGAGADRSIVQIYVHDKKGNKVSGSIAAADGDDAVVVSVAGLDRSEGLDLMVTVRSNTGCISDGHASNLQATGSAGSFDKDYDSLTFDGVYGS